VIRIGVRWTLDKVGKPSAVLGKGMLNELGKIK